MKKLLLTALVAGALSTTVYAQETQKMPSHDSQQGQMMHHGQMMGHGEMMPELNLSDAQKQKIAKIMQDNRPSKEEMKDMRAQFKQDEAENQKLISAETLDKSALASLANKRSEEFKKMFERQITIRHEIWKVLTPEQQKVAAFPPKMKHMGDKNPQQAGQSAKPMLQELPDNTSANK